MLVTVVPKKPWDNFNTYKGLKYIWKNISISNMADNLKNLKIVVPFVAKLHPWSGHNKSQIVQQYIILVYIIILCILLEASASVTDSTRIIHQLVLLNHHFPLELTNFLYFIRNQTSTPPPQQQLEHGT